MQPLDAIRKMLDDSHITPYAAGIATGYSHTYVSNLFNRGTIPGVDRMATIANACDYDLVLIPRNGGDSIPIDYTTKQDATD